MAPDPAGDDGPDLTAGIPLSHLDENGMLRGHVGDQAVLIVRQGERVNAIGAACSHYGGPLDQGLVVDNTVRCPWHHACFSLRTGEAIGAPAISSVTAWKVERENDRIIVREPLDTASRSEQGHIHDGSATNPSTDTPQRRGVSERVLIVGGGAAGFACAEMLRRNDFHGPITILSSDSDAPYDRPQLSKQFLAGGADRDDLPLAAADFYTDNDIDLRLRTDVSAVDLEARTVTESDGRRHEFDYLVLATGSQPVQLSIPGADRSHVHALRTVADCTSIVEHARDAGTAVILGSGFIGLEVAAALTKRGIQVHVVTQDKHPLEKVLGEQLSQQVQQEHEKHGTLFHVETSLARIDEHSVTLEDGRDLPADLVVLGVGVTPRTQLAEDAGLEVDNGVLVDECLRTPIERVYAAGDIAQWNDSRTGARLRVEHWVVAQRQGQHVARNILRGDTPFTDVPFFWTAHHDLSIRYVGHAPGWDDAVIDGDLDEGSATIRFLQRNVVQAIATIGRDKDALKWEAQREQQAANA